MKSYNCPLKDIYCVFLNINRTLKRKVTKNRYTPPSQIAVLI